MNNFTAVLSGLVLIGGAALAQDAVIGAEIYARHCATCHGEEARGNGPMAPALVLQPPDLTGLTARHDGVLPVERIIMRIDGRDPLVSHGSPMPVYGEFFEGTDVILKTETGQPVLTSQPVADLLEYLRGLQE
ncbi:cytochrome c [uncultured Roseobacter sp.]|uniref:c-type cytochrome n=1 Tax=uncultured Roseobacter sp. TaxID=114847 RepID=UPI002612709B|nr:cytochrome c [uncultured Roseobacter sp.]